jgi:hypothetical protein
VGCAAWRERKGDPDEAVAWGSSGATEPGGEGRGAAGSGAALLRVHQLAAHPPAHNSTSRCHGASAGRRREGRRDGEQGEDRWDREREKWAAGVEEMGRENQDLEDIY